MVVEDKIKGGKRHEEMETEGGLQTVCIREEREYLSLSSWMERGVVRMEKKGDEEGERDVKDQ